MATAVHLGLFLSVAVGHAAPLLTAARSAGCGGTDPQKVECILDKLFAPNREQALADTDLSRLPKAPRPPLPGVLETLLQQGDGLMEVQLSKTDKIAILGSGEGRLPILAALLGVAPQIMAVEKEPVAFARLLLALQRLRDVLNNFGEDLVDGDPTCTDRAARGDCAKNPDFMLGNCTRSCYNRTEATRLQWGGIEVVLQQGPPSAANLSQVTLAILGEDGVKGPDRKEVAALAFKLESELSPGSVVWSLDPLLLQGAKAQETDGKISTTVPAGGLVFQRRLHLSVHWSKDVPCHVYIRVPKPSPALRPHWPLNVSEAKRLHEAAIAELVSLGAMRLNGAVLSEGRFASAAQAAYGVPSAAGRRLARAFGAPAAALGAKQDFCRCRPRDSTGHEVSALNLLGMFLLAIHSPGQCMVPPCTASDAILALSTAELRRQLLYGHEESCDVPPQLLRDLGCLRFSDGRSLLHAALGRKDLQLARAALRSQGAGGLFCRDALGRSVLHHAALGKPQIGQVNNFTGALQERVNASEAVDWVMKQMQGAGELLKMVDYSGRSALFFAEDVATLRAMADVGSWSARDHAGRSLLWHAIATNRTDIIAELLCDSAKSKEHRTQLAMNGEDISSSPLLLAARRLARPVCGEQHASKAALEVMTSCTGLRDDFNGSLGDFARSICQNTSAVKVH